MSRRTFTTIALVVALVVVSGASFVIGGRQTDPAERFLGTDSAATAQIQTYHPDYRQWVEPFFQPASGEVESGLFALQAALGGGVLGFAIGGLWGRRRAERAHAAVDPDGGQAPEPAA